jgi:hypothetical protein
MIYQVEIVNPKTNEQKKITVELSPEQADAAKASPCKMVFIQDLARPNMPDGFMPIGGRVNPVTLQ